MEQNHFILKRAESADAEILYSLIIEMATYEKDLHEVETTPEHIRDTLCNQSAATAYIGYYDGTPAAYVIYFYNYSSYQGKRNMYIEDIYIRPENRKKGLGKQIMAFAAKKALEENCSRLDWTCLEWNENARRFYEHLGASHLENRLHYRAEGEVLKNLAMM